MSEPKNTIKIHLEAMVKITASNNMYVASKFYQWILAEGEVHTRNAAAHLDIKQWPIPAQSIAPKECYRTAAMCALRKSDFRYMEGLALHPIGMPIEHAYNSLRYQAGVYDFQATAQWQEDPLAWWGVPVPRHFLLEFLSMEQMPGHMDTALKYYFHTYINR
jgi:hypothetical protein